MERYHVLECIGEGSFGKVFKVQAHRTAAKPSCCTQRNVQRLATHLQGRLKYTADIVALKFIPKHGRAQPLPRFPGYRIRQLGTCGHTSRSVPSSASLR
jgi:serine/threonine protein kinase